jgi:hypothetical protein
LAVGFQLTSAFLGHKRRRDILRRAFEGKIPRADPQKGIEAYMEQWGNPGSSQRLWRIARHLAGQINLKRPNHLQARAVGLWREDLDWLYQELSTYPLPLCVATDIWRMR